MRCSFGYTVKAPYVERRVKYYDEMVFMMNPYRPMMN